MHYVYEWYRMDLNLPYYIGKGQGNRAFELKRENDHTNNVTSYLIRNGIRRDVRIIAYFQTKEAAFEYEKERIAFWWYLKDHDVLTNKTIGGNAPPVQSGENNPAKRPEVRAVLSIQMTGSNNHRYGKKATQETKNRQSKSAKESRAKESEEKKVLRGKRIWETRRANGTDKVGSVINNKEIIICGHKFKSQKEFANYIGMSAAYVTKCLKKDKIDVLERKYLDRFISNDNVVPQ